jgi:hypothetical protein
MIYSSLEKIKGSVAFINEARRSAGEPRNNQSGKIDPFSCDQGQLLDRLTGTLTSKSRDALMGREAAPITNITNL